MAYQIIYKKRFSNKLVKLLEYLEKHWGSKVAMDFLNKLDKRTNTLRMQPFIGKPSEINPAIRTILVSKQNRLYYKCSNNTVIILNMYDTRINPKKNPYWHINFWPNFLFFMASSSPPWRGSCTALYYNIELLPKRWLKRELFLERIFSSSIFEL